MQIAATETKGRCEVQQSRSLAAAMEDRASSLQEQVVAAFGKGLSYEFFAARHTVRWVSPIFPHLPLILWYLLGLLQSFCRAQIDEFISHGDKREV